MSRQRKKHPILVAQRENDNLFVRDSERKGTRPKMPVRCRRVIRLEVAEMMHDLEKEEEEIRQEQYQEMVHEYNQSKVLKY